MIILWLALGITAALLLVLWSLRPRFVAQDLPLPSHAITVQSEDDESFFDRSPVKNKAAVLAINVWKDGNTLSGCDRDGANMTRRILETWGAPEERISAVLEKYWANDNGVYLRVKHGDSELRILRNDRATTDRAIKAMSWLREGVRPNDYRFFYPTMHGTQTPSTTEKDLLNECLVMYNHNWDKPATWFIDDIIERATENLPQNSAFLLLVDTCHSAGLLRSNGGDAQARFLTPPSALVSGRSVKPKAFKSDDYTNESTLLLSGCESDNVSYSNRYTVGGKSVMEGALTHNFLKFHQENPNASLEALYAKLYPILATGKYVQKPQLQGSHILRTKPFLRADA